MCVWSGVKCDEERIIMDIAYRSVETILRLPSEAFVQLRNGIKILLFSVGVALSTPSYGYDVHAAKPIETRLGDDIDISLDNNVYLVPDISYQTEKDLYSSLQQHRGDQMCCDDIDGFWTVAKEVSFLNFTDSMVCYESEDRQITYDILDKTGVVLHITQYLDSPKDQVVFSIEKNATFLAAGHTQVKGMGLKLQQEIDDLVRDNG